jgi:TolA-binding protein
VAEKRAEFAEQTAERNRVAVGKAQKEIAALKTRITELEEELERERERARESEETVFDLEALRGA